tara:strand:- start:239 stop:580 length:342 start_codon:yes stop_codon:yes gene_type:complete
MRATRLSLSLVKAGNIIYISSIIKALEHLAYAREIMREYMLKTEKSGAQISSYEYRFDDEADSLKKNSINVLLELHPSFFQNILEFDDWGSAMEFLMKNQKGVYEFWNIKNDR